MRVHDGYKEINAAQQEQDEDSVLAFYKRMLRLRKEHKDVVVYGTFKLFDAENPNTFVFMKRYGEKTALVALNFTTKKQSLPNTERMKLLQSSYSGGTSDMLQPLEARIYINY
jgi:oligo-1,6-glucosidase